MGKRWMRFTHNGANGFGLVEGEAVAVCSGDMFGEAKPTSRSLALADIQFDPPCAPGKMIGLWNNFHARAAKEGLSRPEHPLYFIKTTNCYAAHQAVIRQPVTYQGPVVFEGELGVVIGKTCRNVSVEAANGYIFGYTSVNDVTAREVLKRDPSFTQWSRAKSFDTFGPFGPWIVTGIDPDGLTVRTLVNGEVRQDYPVADMFFRPREIVSLLSRDMTLHPGDLIACGTSLGAGELKSGDTVAVAIDGVGTLSNRFE
ncbi:MAG: fumarylacetoacetate hydrolase family protein [Pseudomonadota bacterium]|nr:MAG: fumarylacetoacetate hydrolase family protein [Pseudomonadota bacterium]